jgi:general secretion pathway protein G
MFAWELRPAKLATARCEVVSPLTVSARKGPARRRRGFTLVELVIAMAVAMTLAAIAIPSYTRVREHTRVTTAIADIQHLQMSIQAFASSNGPLPNTLADLGPSVPQRDPWGNPYQYLNFANANKGAFRKDRFLVPINSTFDLYSMGPDGASQPPLTARASRDDIVRANDGAFVGPASQY